MSNPSGTDAGIGDGSDATALRALTADVLEVVGRAMGPDKGAALAAADVRVRHNRAHLVVAGQFKRGKTTLVNALVGRDVLPTAVTPLTSVATLVRFGPHETATAMFEGGTSRQIRIDDLAAFVTEAGNPNNARAVVDVTVELPAPALRGGLVLVDLPGTGSLALHNTATAHRFLSQADAALFVLSADPPISVYEIEELALLRRYVSEVICVINKVDQVSASDREAVLSYTRQQLSAAGFADIPIVVASARLALLGPDGSGATAGRHLADLQRAIDERVHARVAAIGAASLRRLALSALRDVEAALELERSAMRLGDREREARSAEFEAIAQSVMGELADGAVIARARAQRAMQADIEPRIRRLADGAAESITRELARGAAADDHADPDPEVRARQFVEAAVGAWVEEVRPVLAAVVDPILQAEVRATNDLRDQAMRRAAALFALAVPPTIASVSEVAVETADLLRLDDQPTGGLELAVVAARRRLPGSVGRRAGRRAASAHAAELVDRHAGRLRAACAQAIDEALRSVARSQRDSLEGTLDLVRAAIDAAEKSARRSAEVQARRLDEIDCMFRRTVALIERVASPDDDVTAPPEAVR